MADGPVDAILERFRDRGGRVTLPRRLVVEAMVTSRHHHFTAGEVVDAVRKRAPDFHESTVYRTLDLLADLGVVDRVELGPGPAVYHLAARSHHHLLCDGCGAIIEAPADLLDDIAEHVRETSGFAMRVEATTLHGRCRNCQD